MGQIVTFQRMGFGARLPLKGTTFSSDCRLLSFMTVIIVRFREEGGTKVRRTKQSLMFLLRVSCISQINILALF